MSNIVISGYYGFGNAGDEAMLCAIIDAIRDVEDDAHITVISGNPQETSRKHNIKAVGTFAAFGICLLYPYPSPRDRQKYRMPSSA